MTVYSFYIFDRHTECVYAKSWLPNDRNSSNPPTAPGIQSPPPQQQKQPLSISASDDDAKLIFGTVFSLRNMVRKLGGDDDAFISYRTAGYKLHFYETPANLRFVLLTDTATMGMRNVLHQIYINLWVEYGAIPGGETLPFVVTWERHVILLTCVCVCSLPVVKNPLAPVEHKGGVGVKNELFELGLDQFIRGLM
ncbi:Transport protein particle subunit-like protein [Hapsidospora chrysogenum ATCC 11550]|uniref:Trafficking protein particle complex subunit n=1 Tax=Hapsidospora chrysogenum (strain ATCC 11550 / CBS 779.69 / DSM 880 / IAM 14645 / JCM 23072 / IMI 49137) TaxID=857340 RepID=A0A086TFD2_HAPC1|nr:Transport protein particle subunit-like protein [Hapsidospora chrysogenum ATCC 11550]